MSRGSLRGLLTRCIVTTGKHLLLYRQFIRNFFLHSHTHNYKLTLHPNHPIHPNTFIYTILRHYQGYSAQETRGPAEAWKVQISCTPWLQRAALTKAQTTTTPTTGARSAYTAFIYYCNIYLLVYCISFSFSLAGQPQLQSESRAQSAQRPDRQTQHVGGGGGLAIRQTSAGSVSAASGLPTYTYLYFILFYSVSSRSDSRRSDSRHSGPTERLNGSGGRTSNSNAGTHYTSPTFLLINR